MHLHWGDDYRGGSEHTINGRRYFGEVHIVHYEVEYHNLRRVFKMIIARLGAKPIKLKLQKHPPIRGRVKSIDLKTDVSEALEDAKGDGVAVLGYFIDVRSVQMINFCP